MAGENTTITTYRRALDSTTGKTQYSSTPTLIGIPVHIQLESLQKAQIMNQAGMLRTYRFFSEDNLDVKESDKVVDHLGGTYIVHTVQKELSHNGTTNHTIVILTRSGNV